MDINPTKYFLNFCRSTLTFKVQQDSEKEIVQQILKGSHNEETSIFENVADLIYKQIFQCFHEHLNFYNCFEEKYLRFSTRYMMLKYLWKYKWIVLKFSFFTKLWQFKISTNFHRICKYFWQLAHFYISFAVIKYPVIKYPVFHFIDQFVLKFICNSNRL